MLSYGPTYPFPPFLAYPDDGYNDARLAEWIVRLELYHQENDIHMRRLQTFLPNAIAAIVATLVLAIAFIGVLIKPG